MDEKTLVAEYFAKFNNEWEKESPAGEEALQILSSGKHVPPEYIEFLRYSNGGIGEIPVDPGQFILWRAEDLEAKNKMFQCERNDWFAFGSSGGGSYFVFSTREQGFPVYQTDANAIGDPDGTEKVAENFLEFLRLFGTGEWEEEFE